MTDVREPFQAQDIRLTPLTPEGELIVVGAAAQPVSTQPSILGRYGLFLAMFVLPVLLSAVYLFGIASDRYMSEAQFVVRSTSAAGVESAAAMLSSRGLSQAHDETYVVNQFIGSRDALTWLLKSENLKEVFNRPQADIFNRYPALGRRDTEESLYQYYKKMVWSEVQDSTGISTIYVVAFTAQDARRIAAALLGAAEDLLNRLNKRSEDDAVNQAKKAVDDARAQMNDVERRLSEFRSKAGFVDAQRENTAEMQTVTKLSTEVAHMRADLQRERSLTPSGPAIETTKSRISAYEAEIERRKSAMAGDNASIASNMGGYDELVFEKTIAEKAWSAAETARIAARANSERQHLYLQAVVDPNTPDVATYPRRWLYLALTALVAGVAFSIVRALRQFAMEHTL